MGKLQPERFEVIFSSENRLRFFFGNKVRDPLITYLLERDISIYNFIGNPGSVSGG